MTTTEDRTARDPKDQWLFLLDRTDAELTLVRESLAKGSRHDNPDPSAYTCHTCPLLRRCTLAYDPYNQDGDCLYEK